MEISKKKKKKWRVEMYCLTQEGKRLLVQVIGSFENLRLLKIGIPLQDGAICALRVFYKVQINLYCELFLNVRMPFMFLYLYSD